MKINYDGEKYLDLSFNQSIFLVNLGLIFNLMNFVSIDESIILLPISY